MQQFLLLFVGYTLQPGDGSAQTQAYMQGWGEWMAGLASKGILVTGSPLEWRGKVVKKDAVTDLQLQQEDIGGYLLIRAESLDEAVEIAKQAPHMALGGTTIVRPCLDVNR
ncbi:MAG TPA: YciI family protein [Ktedonobacteraceae bacterium]